MPRGIYPGHDGTGSKDKATGGSPSGGAAAAGAKAMEASTAANAKSASGTSDQAAHVAAAEAHSAAADAHFADYQANQGTKEGSASASAAGAHDASYQAHLTSAFNPGAAGKAHEEAAAAHRELGTAGSQNQGIARAHEDAADRLASPSGARGLADHAQNPRATAEQAQAAATYASANPSSKLAQTVAGGAARAAKVAAVGKPSDRPGSARLASGAAFNLSSQAFSASGNSTGPGNKGTAANNLHDKAAAAPHRGGKQRHGRDPHLGASYYP